MSFFTYYGKIKDELLVAILPSGTVQPGDSIYLYTKQKLSQYTAGNVSNIDDGDRFEFQHGSETYVAESKSGYKQINLTLPASVGDKHAVLTRQYAEPSSGQHLTNRPKIWTGSINFHQWAKNEPFLVLAPQGLGNSKPVVSIWQWTKDDKGAANTLSHATGVQESSAHNTSIFSFKQNDYYTLACRMDSATSGLEVTVSSPSNPEQVQQELTLTAKIEPGERHKLSPPRGVQNKVSVDCSLPQEKTSLERISTPLPFPSDLIETLKYSAAYVDQAGYMAKYAIDQYDKLNQEYHSLENRLDEKATSITGLKETVLELRKEVSAEKKANTDLKKSNKDLEDQLAKERKAAQESEAKLRKELARVQADLVQSQRYLKAEQSLNEKLRGLIAKDKLEDIERERKHKQHDQEDHKIIEGLQKTIQDQKIVIAKKDTEIANRQAEIDRLQGKLKAEKEQNRLAQEEITFLRADLKKAENEITALRSKFADKSKALKKAQADLKAAQADIKTKTAIIAELEVELRDTLSALESAMEESVAKSKKIGGLERKLTETQNTLKETQKKFSEAEADIKILEAKLKTALDDRDREIRKHAETKADRDRAEVNYNNTRTALRAMQTALDSSELDKAADKTNYENTIQELRAAKTGAISTVTELQLPNVH